MKPLRKRVGTIGVICVLLSGPAGRGQGNFQNLGFESATIVPVVGDPAGRIQFPPAFPYWIGTINGQTQSVTLYNNAALSTPSFILFGGASPGRLDGNYTAALQANSMFVPTVTSLFQTGLVPNDSLSLRFFGTIPNGLAGGQLTVSLDGTPLSLSVLQNFGTYSLYAADVSPFAGHVAELKFQDAVPAQGVSTFLLDNISFSPIGVPEPRTWALFALGSALFWYAARRHRKGAIKSANKT